MLTPVDKKWLDFQALLLYVSVIFSTKPIITSVRPRTNKLTNSFMFILKPLYLFAEKIRSNLLGQVAPYLLAAIWLSLDSLAMFVTFALQIPRILFSISPQDQI